MTKTVKHKDTDYLAVSTYVRALENSLLTREQLEQLITAPSREDARKLLQTFGYGELEPMQPEALDAALSRVRAQTLEELAAFLPDSSVTDVFRVPYDYHNVKAMLKAEAMGVSPDTLLTDLGRVSVADLRATQRDNDNSALPETLALAMEVGREVLSRTRDPQLLDVAVDKYYFRDLLETAERTGNPFLVGYVRLQIDAANLRTLVRTLRMGKHEDFLRGALFERGKVPTEDLLSVCVQDGAGLAECFASTSLAEAAAEGAKLRESLTAFERLCDDAQTAYLSRAQLVPFGEEALLSYLAARETEYVNLRVVLMGRVADVPAEILRSRLRAGV